MRKLAYRQQKLVSPAKVILYLKKIENFVLVLQWLYYEVYSPTANCSSSNLFPSLCWRLLTIVELEMVEEYWLEIAADLLVVQGHPLLFLDAVKCISHSIPVLLVSIFVWLLLPLVYQSLSVDSISSGSSTSPTSSGYSPWLAWLVISRFHFQFIMGWKQ